MPYDSDFISTQILLNEKFVQSKINQAKYNHLEKVIIFQSISYDLIFVLINNEHFYVIFFTISKFFKRQVNVQSFPIATKIVTNANKEAFTVLYLTIFLLSFSLMADVMEEKNSGIKVKCFLLIFHRYRSALFFSLKMIPSCKMICQ